MDQAAVSAMKKTETGQEAQKLREEGVALGDEVVRTGLWEEVVCGQRSG